MRLTKRDLQELRNKNIAMQRRAELNGKKVLRSGTGINCALGGKRSQRAYLEQVDGMRRTRSRSIVKDNGRVWTPIEGWKEA